MDATQAANTTTGRGFRHSPGQRLYALLLRPLWLPRPVYQAVPWLYLVTGSNCLIAGLYVPDGSWILPYAILVGLACLHGAVLVVSMRRPGRKRPSP